MNTNPLDPLPIWAVYLLTFAIMIIATEIGFRIGRAKQRKTPDIKEEGPGGALAGVTLGLLAFLLAFVIGLAATRFDNRKALVMGEANSVGTTYLRAGFLPEADGDRSRVLLTEYVDSRIAAAESDDPSVVVETIARDSEILAELWSIAETVGNEISGSETVALYIDSLNETIDIGAERNFAVVYTRLPSTIVMGMYIIAALGLVIVGFNNGLQENRSIIPLIVTILVFSIVMLLIVDLDRPQEGFLQVSQQPLIDLQTQMHAETSPT